ncbi:MAG: hypothetical protein KBT27_14845 [Prevotellaceae bacterium]|nr:hypothetical protein [Candidatus Faecinaster equi]
MALLSVNAWGEDGTTHVWHDSDDGKFSAWGYNASSWSRNNCATLPTLTYTPSYPVKKVVLNAKGTNTTGSSTVTVTIGGQQVGDVHNLNGDNTAYDIEFTPSSSLSGTVVITCINTSSQCTTGQGSFVLYSITLTEGSSVTYTDLFAGHKSGHFRAFFLAPSQIVILGFFAFFCKKVFHIRCTEGAWRMHGGSRPSSLPFFSPFGTLFAQPPFLLIYNVSASYIYRSLASRKAQPSKLPRFSY